MNKKRNKLILFRCGTPTNVKVVPPALSDERRTASLSVLLRRRLVSPEDKIIMPLLARDVKKKRFFSLFDLNFYMIFQRWNLADPARTHFDLHILHTFKLLQCRNHLILFPPSNRGLL